MPINDEVQLAKPLDPVYAVTEYQRAKPRERKPHSEAFNRWRRSLPDCCYQCGHFDKCSPGHKCPHNPNCK